MFQKQFKHEINENKLEQLFIYKLSVILVY
jgi:hypothetical protein